MGSFASRPKAPSVQYVPVYTPVATTAGQTPATPDTTPDTTGGEPTSTETKSAQRTASLLERERGRLSTIATGFRGLLANSNTTQRKTLLGE